MARTIRWFGLSLLTILVLAGASAGWGYAEIVRPGPLASDKVVLIPRGLGVPQIADTLLARDAITSALLFRIAARTVGRDKLLRAGEFRIPTRSSLREIIDILDSGQTVVRRLTVAEGVTVRQVVAQLNKTEGLTGLITRSPEEGALLPETYHFSYGDLRSGLVRRMQGGMTKLLGELWSARAPNLPYRTPQEALILASIVERETGRSDERARIAGVFVNRLRRGMRLQSDPTVAYGLSEGWGKLERPLSRADLKRRTPFNTYVVSGLPPTPISNPGRAAIEAVLRPADTGELYFVANGDGGHAFARTLAAHNRNVARWRRLRRERLAK